MVHLWGRVEAGQVSRRARRRGAAGIALMASAMALPAMGQSIVNSGFETGDTTGWTTTGGYWSSGWPVPESQYQGPAHLISMMTAGGVDAITGAPTVFEGNYALRLNDQYGGNDISALSQSVTGYVGNKLYYAWNAVVEPSHGADDSPSFLIKVVDQTTNTVVTNIAYSAYSAQNSPIFRTVGNFVTTDWKVEDIDVISGHDYKLVFVAVDCIYGGHGGYVYIDGFGNSIPIANANVPFDPATGLTRGADFLLPIGGMSDINLAQPFYLTSAVLGGSVLPNFNGGTLKVDSAGPVATAFTVQATNGTIDTDGNSVEFSGSITGVGGLAKTGLGTLTLSNINMLGGSFAVNGGALNVSGTLSALDVQVNAGGTLSGTGGIVAPVFVNAGGVLAPGDAIGTLTVTDNVTLGTGSTLALDIDGRSFAPAGGAGTYDRLILEAGGIFTAGGTIAPNLRDIAAPANNNFTPVLGDRFTVVTAAGINGQFASVAQPTAGLAANTRFDTLYRPTSVDLVVTPGNFATLGRSAGWRRNAIAAGAGLDRVRPTAGSRNGVLQPLFDGLYGNNAAGYGTALQQLSGEIHAQAMAVGANAAHDTSNLALSASTISLGREGCADGSDRGKTDAAKCIDPSKSPAIWTRMLYQKSQFDADQTATGFENKQYGFITGMHLVNQDDTRIGIGGRYSDNELSNESGGTASANGYTLFGYASQDFGGLTLSGTLGWGTTMVDTARTQTLTTGASVAKADYKMETLNAAVEVRYALPLGKTMLLRPVAGIAYDHVSANGVRESNTGNSVAALTLPKESWGVTRAKLGAELGVRLGSAITATVGGTWNRVIDGDPTARRAVNIGPAAWSVESVGISQDSYEFGAGLAAAISPRAKVQVEYTGMRDSNSYKADRAMVGLSYAF
jgi:outer membrane autotransporter protein